MKKLRLSQVTWCYPLLSQTASFSKHPSTSESLLCKFLKNKRWFLILLTCFAVNHGPFQVSGSHWSLKWLCQWGEGKEGVLAPLRSRLDCGTVKPYVLF